MVGGKTTATWKKVNQSIGDFPAQGLNFSTVDLKITFKSINNS